MKFFSESKNLFELTKQFVNLEYLPRTGFAMSHIENAQSLAEHSFGVCIWTLLLMENMPNYEIDKFKVMAMAVLHEAAETKMGDIPYPAKCLLGEKTTSKAESLATSNLFCELPNWCEFWKEFEERNSLEARIVNAADKLEMMHRILCYEATGKKFDELFWTTPANFYDGEISEAKNLYDKLIDKHNELINKPTRE